MANESRADAIPLVAAPPPTAAVPPITAPRKEEPKREEAKRDEPRKKQLPAAGRDMLWSPTIRAALIAGTPWLDHFLSRLRDDAPSTATRWARSAR